MRRCAVAGSCSGTASARMLPPLRRSPSANPRQRSSSPLLPDSWLTHSARLTPSRPIRRPASTPARYSGWPTCASTPSFLNWSLPELIVTTGIPARTAARIDGASACASGSETTMPSGRSATASSMKRFMRSIEKLSGAR